MPPLPRGKPRAGAVRKLARIPGRISGTRTTAASGQDDHSGDSNSRRWLFYWNHSGVVDQVWRFNADYTKVSDPDYFNDFSSKYGSSTDGYATQKLSAGYANQNFDATVSTKQFQVFNRDSSNAYSAEPQLDVN